MHKRLENKLTMYEGLLTLLQDNSDKIQSISAFGEAVTKFSDIMQSIKAKSIEVDQAAAGKTSGKLNAEEALIECLLPVCSALFLFGRKENNTAIMERANTAEYKVRLLRDSELASYGNAIAEMASGNKQGISGYGVTEEKIAELKTKAEAYVSAIGERESGIAGRKGARETMTDLFKEADEIIGKEIDNYMEIVRPLEPEFYTKYYAAKVIKDMGIRHRQEEAEPAGTAAN